LGPGLDNFGSPWPGVGLDGPLTSHLLNLGVRSGSLNSVRADAVAISSELADKAHVKVGAILHARFADRQEVALRVAAIYANALGPGDIVMTAQLVQQHATTLLDNAAFLTGWLSAPTLRQLEVLMPNAVLLTRAAYLTSDRAPARLHAAVTTRRYLPSARMPAQLGGPRHHHDRRCLRSPHRAPRRRAHRGPARLAHRRAHPRCDANRLRSSGARAAQHDLAGPGRAPNAT
ncbi:MAG TPA: hypothetical protein VGH56_12730, partial [Solirubrobacteraceae bacterium]